MTNPQWLREVLATIGFFRSVMRVIVKEYDEYVEVKTDDKRAAATSCWPKLVGCGRSYKCTGRVMVAEQPTVLTFGFVESPGVYHVTYEPL